MKKLAFLFLLLFASPLFAQGVRFPASPTGTKLTADSLYVVDSDDPIFLELMQDGLVVVTEEVGPLRIRARFVDSGKVETRTFKGKQIFILEAAGNGRLDFLVIKDGVTKATRATGIIRKSLDVSFDGVTPKPDPDPTPKLGTLAHLTLVGPELFPWSLEVANTAAIKTFLNGNGVKMWVITKGELPKQSPGFIKGVASAGGPPIVILQDASGAILATGPMVSAQGVMELAAKHLKK